MQKPRRAAPMLLVLLLECILLGCGEEPSTVPVLPGPVNHPPMLQPQADTSIAVGDTLFLQASGSDPDGDLLTYRVVVQMSWHQIVYGPWPMATIDQGTGLLRFVPQNFDVPGRRFSFRVSDPLGAADTTRFYVSVEEKGSRGPARPRFK